MDRATSRPGNRLFRYDRRIVVNATRATFARWHDRILAVVLLLLLIAVLRATVADRPWPMTIGLGAGIGILLGMAVARSIAARLVHHADYGPLAADALDRATCWRYTAIVHSCACGALAILAAIVRPVMAIPVEIGYLIGGTLGYAIHPIVIDRAAGKSRIGRIICEQCGRPRAGLAGAAIVLPILLALWLNNNDRTMLVAIAGVASVGITLALTIVDDAQIRFLTAAGWSSRRIVARHSGGALTFVLIAASACLPLREWAVACASLAGTAAGMLLMALRILAYRLHRRRFADILVAVLAAMLVFIGVAMPVALPLALIVMFWNLGRRASARTWMVP